MSEYDFDHILTRLREGAGDRFSTIEGTFAGDLLGAVANELARIYSMELETLCDRAFVATADGPWLDAACADYGLSRLEDEDDDALRARALAYVRGQAAGGNAADYRSWALEVPGVRAAQAFGRLRGANTVDVFVLPREGTVQADVVSAAAAHIEERRPICADVRVAAAESFPVAVSAVLTLDGSIGPTAVKAAFEARLRDWMDAQALTSAGTLIGPGRISAMLLDCPGVLDVAQLTINSSVTAVTVPSGKYAVAGTVTLSEEDDE